MRLRQARKIIFEVMARSLWSGPRLRYKRSTIAKAARKTWREPLPPPWSSNL